MKQMSPWWKSRNLELKWACGCAGTSAGMKRMVESGQIWFETRNVKLDIQKCEVRNCSMLMPGNYGRQYWIGIATAPLNVKINIPKNANRGKVEAFECENVARNRESGQNLGSKSKTRKWEFDCWKRVEWFQKCPECAPIEYGTFPSGKMTEARGRELRI
jgi:hypothetical protein